MQPCACAAARVPIAHLLGQFIGGDDGRKVVEGDGPRPAAAARLLRDRVELLEVVPQRQVRRLLRDLRQVAPAASARSAR